jgi:hypothetical protein
LRGGVEHRFHNSAISSAPAQIPSETFSYLVDTGRRVTGEQRIGCDDQAWCAKAALHGSRSQERILEVGGTRVGDSLNRDDRTT